MRELRLDKKIAREVLEFLLPDEKARRLSLQFLANSIRTADQLAPDRWGITLFTDTVRLNFGRIEAMSIRPEELLEVTVDADSLPPLPQHLEVDVHAAEEGRAGRGVLKTEVARLANLISRKSTVNEAKTSAKLIIKNRSLSLMKK